MSIHYVGQPDNLQMASLYQRHTEQEAWLKLHRLSAILLAYGKIVSEQSGYPAIHGWVTSGSQLVRQRLWYVPPACGKVHIKDPLMLIGMSSLCGDRGLPLKKYVTMTICLTSNSQ